ncbi:MAG: homoserine O-acetyltransferase, partial [Verrucomicrobiota bacterium]|nr:homoserine O-acetyltransferase [Verrucomicrobiota bacterium]
MNDAEDIALPAVAGSPPGEIGLVEPHDFVCKEPFTFESGQTLPGFTLRYETYGRLNSAKDNTVLICHALSGDHHCAGIYSLADRKPGWWNNFIGPGKAVDTNKFFVLCSNCLGGCQGSSGPSSIDPRTGRPFGITFPFVSIRDMVRAQKLLCDHLGLTSLYAITGGSMGGMQVLQWPIEFPGFVRKIIPLATTARESAQAIAFNEVGRQAIIQDLAWNGGDYPRDGGPRVGLAIARMMAHITYLSDASMDRKFGRKRFSPKTRPATGEQFEALDSQLSANTATTPGAYNFDVQFEVESYLRHQGQTFINRFDANSYLYITRALDHFDLATAYGSLEAAFAPVQAETLCVGFASDWLFPPEQNRAIILALLRANKRASYAELSTDLGHDSFLLESPQL